MFRLDQKSVVVTGGGSGIGKAVAELMARQGAIVHIIEITEEKAMSVADKVKADGGMAVIHACDVGDQLQVNSIFQKIGRVDVLVNNAGIAHVGTVLTTTEEDFDRVYRVNVKGIYNCLQAAVLRMKDRGGVIINMASIAAHVGLADRFAYTMSKGAVMAMTLSVAKDFLKSGIRCNSISPARVHTPFVDGFIASNYPGKEKEMFETLSASQPVGRMGTVEEVANLVLYLSSDEASFITGNDYLIDGGFIKLNN